MTICLCFSNKEVAEANFDLHVSHCRRFLCLCPDCDESVPRAELEKHKEEQHGEVLTSAFKLVHVWDSGVVSEPCKTAAGEMLQVPQKDGATSPDRA